MGRPLLLDLYCGAGGAAMGYHRAGFDVVGVDIVAQPDYPFEFIQEDAIEFVRNFGFHYQVVAIHASPPCRDHTRYTSRWGTTGSGALLADTRTLLNGAKIPYVIENVPGAPMRVDLRLCGCMFGLPGLRRSRWFESSVALGPQPAHGSHDDHTVTVSGHPGGSSTRDGKRGFGSTAQWREAMGIDWMPAKAMAQAIPPASHRICWATTDEGVGKMKVIRRYFVPVTAMALWLLAAATFVANSAHADPLCNFRHDCPWSHTFNGQQQQEQDTPGTYGGWTTNPVYCDPYSGGTSCRVLVPGR